MKLLIKRPKEMFLVSKIRKAINIISRQAKPMVTHLNLLGSLTGEAPQPTNYDEYADLYRTVAWVYACIKKVASKSSRVPYDIFKKRRIEGKWVDKRIDDDDEKRYLFKHPNDKEMFPKLMRGLVTHLQLHGNGYWEKVRKEPGGEKSKVIGLFNVRPDRILIVPNKDGKGIKEYIFQIRKHMPKTTLPPYNVIHFDDFSATDDFYGQSPLAAAVTTIIKEQYIDKYQQNIVKSDAIPRGVLESEFDIDDVEARRILDNWNNKFAGIDKQGSLAILPLGLKFKQLSFTPKDIEYMKLLLDNRQRLFSIFGVNNAVMGLTEGITKENYKLQIRSFYEDTVQGWLLDIEDSITQHYLWDQFDDKYSIKFDVGPLIREEEAIISSRFQKEIMVGVSNPNEARAALGREPYEGGNTFMIMSNLMPFASEDAEMMEAIEMNPNNPFGGSQQSEGSQELLRDPNREMAI